MTSGPPVPRTVPLSPRVRVPLGHTFRKVFGQAKDIIPIKFPHSCRMAHQTSVPSMYHSPTFKIFLLALLACAWFFSPGSWNQTARYDSIQALAEHGTFCIDAYLLDPEHNNNTGDWARHQGRYYSNKAPGTMFLGALAYAPVYWAERAFLAHAPGSRLNFFNFWWVNFWCSTVPTAVLAMIFYLLLKKCGVSQNRSLFWSLALVFATPLWPYAGAMWGHNLAALFLALAFFFAVQNAPSTHSPDNPDHPENPDHPAHPASSVFLGLFAGLAVVTDYLAIAAIPCFTLFFLLQKRWRAFLNFALGGLLPLIIYCFYHWKCFGNPFLPATFFNNPGFLDAAAAGGIVAGFKTNVVARLLIGMPHGLFWCAPLCLFALPGFLALWRSGGEHRALGLLATGWFLLSLILNASFNGWHGGSGIGPRYLLPAFPAWAFLAAAAPMRKHWQRWLAVALTLVSVANMFVVANLTPLVSELVFNPYAVNWKYFLQGTPAEFPLQPISPGTLFGRLRHWANAVMLLIPTLLILRPLLRNAWQNAQFAQIRSNSLRRTGPFYSRWPC